MAVLSKEHLRFSTGILRRLGEELNPSPDQGILELVRNAYDADARKCTIELLGADQAGGAIKITDNGLGMKEEDIRNGWLVLGSSEKQKGELTPIFQRVPVGSKGLGRLAALRLGHSAVVRTRPRDQAREFMVRLPWDEYDVARLVESVELPLQEVAPTLEESGTEILVENIRQGLTHNDVRRLARAMILLADPFQDQRSFRPRLVAPEFRDLEKLVQAAYFTEAEFHLTASVNSQGEASARVEDWLGKILFSAEHDDISRPKKDEPKSYKTPAAVFELWVFNLDSAEFAGRTVSKGEVQTWLREFGGVHLYHQGLRVHPYGDRGYDWLEMNLSRARSPELRPSTNTSIGRIQVDDPHDILKQKTDRSGFMESDAFADLRRFAIDSMNWMARRRLQIRESAKDEESRHISKNVEAAQLNIATALKKIAPRTRRQIEAAVSTYSKARDRELQTVREELQLYRTLSTVGTTSAVVAHEVKKPVRQISAMAKMIERVAQREVSESKYESSFAKPITFILRAVEALKTFANVTTTLLQRDKRRRGKVYVHEVIANVLKLFAPLMDETRIDYAFQRMQGEPFVLGTVAALESVVTNLLTNSLNAFTYKHARTANRKVVFRTELGPDVVVVTILDNGPGIGGISPKEIWLPGQTTTSGGTGLGLTIVKDTIRDLGGRVSATPNGELGGAAFTITLPVVGVD
jgi:signal transduction histidine kinase